METCKMKPSSETEKEMKPSLTIEIPKIIVSFDDAEDDLTGKKRRVRSEEDNGLKHTKIKKAKNA
jgi:hypothetical protein